jgi:prepilin-type processing-associated H-X9-DG protein
MSYVYWGYLIDLADENILLPTEIQPLAVQGKNLTVPAQLVDVYMAVNKVQSGWGPSDSDLDKDIPAPLFYPGTGNSRGNTIYRLREGIERFLITDINNPAASAKAQSTIIIASDMISNTGSDALFNHIPGGANVLYMDGHIEFQKYDKHGPMPCNELIANAVGLLAQPS